MGSQVRYWSAGAKMPTTTAPITEISHTGMTLVRVSRLAGWSLVTHQLCTTRQNEQQKSL
jgi:hypothetical protein